MTHLVYKVCRIIDGEFYSSFAEDNFRIKYKVGGIIIPSIGKIFAFSKLEDAKSYAIDMIYDGKEMAIFFAEAYRVEQPEFIGLPSLPCTWNDFWSHSMHPDLNGIPPLNTILCQKLELLYRVY
jgi:hypothetical protein